MRALQALLPLALTLSFSAPAAPQASAEQEARPAQAAEPLLYVYCGGPRALFVDPRDAGLLRAVGMLQERLLELPLELEGELPEPVLRLAVDALFHAHDLALWLLAPGETQDWAPPVDAQLRVFGDAGVRESIGRGIEGVLAMGGMASQPVEGATWQRVPLPMGSLLHGALPAPAGGREGYFVSFGEPRTTAPRAAGTGLAPGIEPALVFRFDMAPLRPYMEMAIDMSGPQGEFLFELLDRFGLMSDKPLASQLAVGHGADRMHLVGRTVNGVAMLESLGGLVREPLPAERMRMIPADAVQAYMSRMSLDFVADLVALLEDASGEDLMDQAAAFLGVHPKTDLLDPLGSFLGYYMADSTGGGGVLSTVVFLELDDEAKMEDSLDKLARRADALAAQRARGYVAVRSWEEGGFRCRSLQFPGLPVPFEPALAVHGGCLWIGASRQALLGALTNAKAAAGGAKGLLGLERFTQALPGSTEGLYAFSWQDSGRLLRQGYGLATLLTNALANAARSPRDPQRDPGVVLPGYAELAQSARPLVMAWRIEGDDLVMRGEGDRSIAVNATALFANPFLLLYGAGMAAGITAQRFEEQSQERILRATIEQEDQREDH